jgi:hypothetical protein
MTVHYHKKPPDQEHPGLEVLNFMSTTLGRANYQISAVLKYRSTRSGRIVTIRLS